MSRQIEMLPLDELEADPRNPKAHREDLIESSVERFGYVEPMVVDGRTGYLISGHGRRSALQKMESAGEDPPDGVEVDEDGRWLAPVVTGWASSDDNEAAAALIAMNRTTELGGWVDDALLDLLDEISDEVELDGTGYDDESISLLRDKLDNLGDEEPERPEYVRDVNIPQYQITGEEPDAADLADRSKTDELIAEINETEDLPGDLREFLLTAAQRHTVFDYAAIAESYAHQPPHIQRLFEKSALVIIDINDGIRYGYVRLTEFLANTLNVDTEEDVDDV